MKAYVVMLFSIFCVASCLPPNPLNNTRPRANIDASGVKTDRFLSAECMFRLDGTASTDDDGDTLTYAWTLVYSDTGDYSQKEAVFVPDNARQAVDARIIDPVPGKYLFMLVVNDGITDGDPAFVTCTIAEPDAWVAGQRQDYMAASKYSPTVQGGIDIAYASGSGEPIVAVLHKPGGYNERIDVAGSVRVFGIEIMGELPRVFSDISVPIGDEDPENTVGENDAVIRLNEGSGIENIRAFVSGGSGKSSCKAVIAVLGTGASIRDCLIEADSGYSKSDGIVVLNGASLTMTHTIVRGAEGEGLVVTDNATFVSGMSVIRDTNGSGLWIMPSASAVIERFVVYRAGYHGVDLNSCGSVSMDHCTILDTAVEKPAPATMLAAIHVFAGADVSVTNTLVSVPGFADHSALYFENVAIPSIVRCTNNYLYVPASASAEFFSYSGTDPSYVDVMNNNTSHSNPLVIDPDQYDFRLAPGSPASGQGENDTNPGADFAF